MSEHPDLPDWLTVGAKIAEVANPRGLGYDVAIVTVDRLTATQIVCTGHPWLTNARYRRSDLRRLGESYGPQLMPLTAPEARAGLARTTLQVFMRQSDLILRDCGYSEKSCRAALDRIGELIVEARTKMGWTETTDA